MIRIILWASLIVFAINEVSAQKLMTRSGKVEFFSAARLENIAAVNKQVTILINSANGAVAVKMPIRSFKFEKALMEEHFNENYLESEKYPEASFSGKILDLTKVNFTESGSYKVEVSGKLTMHGVSQQVAYPATIVVVAGKVKVNCVFKVKLTDYGIKNDKVDNIAETIEIKVDGELNPL